ncbi:MAG: type II toxin-antitoxin system Phd/YefM family antitoxin [Caldilineaceae bacterium]|nr:type II toxin-antitoxin system Phd/YefM family antitoxin [Caldilineaceae bacterium]
MKVSSADFRKTLAKWIDTANGGEPVIVERHGQDIAALVSMNELTRWQLDGDAGNALSELRNVYSTQDDSEIFKKLVLDWSYASDSGESKTKLIKAIKIHTDRIPDIESEIAEIRQLIAPMLERLMSLEAARAVGCDSAANFDDEGMEL